MDHEKKLIAVHEVHEHHDKVDEKEYGKLTLVIAAIVFISFNAFLLFDGHGPFRDLSPFQSLVAQFMGVFFIVFAGFKLVNLTSFVHGFSMYDVIAKRSTLYARIYPFLQLAVGLAMFVLPSYAFTHLVALVLSGIALVGVVLSLTQKREIQCACLGNVIKMPLATVSGIEDGIMFVLSTYMFVAMLAGG